MLVTAEVAGHGTLNCVQARRLRCAQEPFKPAGVVGAPSAEGLLQPRVDPVNTGRPPDLIKESCRQE